MINNCLFHFSFLVVISYLFRCCLWTCLSTSLLLVIRALARLQDFNSGATKLLSEQGKGLVQIGATRLWQSVSCSQVLSRYKHQAQSACATLKAPGGANWWWQWSRTRGKAPEAPAGGAGVVGEEADQTLAHLASLLTTRCRSSGAAGAGRTTLNCSACCWSCVLALLGACYLVLAIW